MRYASLSLDLDNQWSYMKTHGDSGWESHPSYLDAVVPRILEFLAARRLTISFFIVGQDAALEKNRAALRAIAAAGHEIGNHSFRHEPWLHLYTEAELDQELRQAEDAIESATGVRPRGFRGPGFSLSQGTLETLLRRGYQYDATVFPNLLNPLARAYLFSTSNLTAEEKKQRSALFGTWKDAFRPVRPFQWRLKGGRLLEIPVTTLPGLKLPMHLSYLIYLAKFSRVAARAYLRFALAACRLTGTRSLDTPASARFHGARGLPGARVLPRHGPARATASSRLSGSSSRSCAEDNETSRWVSMRDARRRAGFAATLTPVFPA